MPIKEYYIRTARRLQPFCRKGVLHKRCARKNSIKKRVSLTSVRNTRTGRSDWTGTSGLLVPNQAHYQTVPHPEMRIFTRDNHSNIPRCVCQERRRFLAHFFLIFQTGRDILPGNFRREAQRESHRLPLIKIQFFASASTLTIS